MRALHAISSLADLDFDRRPIQRLSSLGDPYIAWVPTGMPRIPQGLIDNTFFLFGSEEDALAGRMPRGTGFFVTFGRDWNSSGFVLAVTNWHVAVRGGASVIRLNSSDGGPPGIYWFDPADWIFDPKGPDLAVLPFEINRDRHGHITPVSDRLFAIEKDALPYWRTGVGEDAFMIGMFVDHQAKETNMPAARFGHVSMLPNKDALIKQPNDHLGACFVIDIHSRTGFSGSPVFAYRTLGSDLVTNTYALKKIEFRYRQSRSLLRNAPPELDGGIISVENMLVLLGVQCGQFPEYWPINGKKAIVTNDEGYSPMPKGEHVEGVSGMTCVIPAWQITELLNMPELKKIRAKQGDDEDLSAPRAESAPPDTGENPKHREDFNRLLDVAARKPKPVE